MRRIVYGTLKQNNIFSRKYFYPLTADADCYAGRFSNNNIDVARDISKRVLVLPLYPELEDEVIEEIVRVIASAQISLAYTEKRCYNRNECNDMCNKEVRDMDSKRVLEFYNECMNMDLGKMLELISNTESEEEKNFYTELYNYVIKKRQRELVANGVY